MTFVCSNCGVDQENNCLDFLVHSLQSPGCGNATLVLKTEEQSIK